MARMNNKYTLIGLTLLSACSFVPDYERPMLDAPAEWSAQGAPQSIAVARDWWTTFGSAELNGLMDKALANNNDIRASLQRIEQARGLLKISKASFMPSVGYSGGASREFTTRPDDAVNNLSAGASVSYELDLFGQNRAEAQSADADLQASQFNHEALKLLVMADVAQAYFNVLNARERLRIADDNLNNAREVLRIVEARFEAGASDALEVAQQKSSLSSAEASRALVEESIKNFENALAVLVGEPPQSIVVAGKNLKELNVPLIAPGQPSLLVERRPDIRAQEAALVAVNADIGAARAAFFPSITLGAGASLATSAFGNPASSALSLSSSLIGPIFQGGALLASLRVSQARQLELVEDYKKEVLTSFQEVEDALAAVKASGAREASLYTAMQEARKSYELSRTRYDAGTIDFQTLLDSQRTLLSAEDAFATSKNERLGAAVTLFRALGGGWNS